MIEFAVLLLCFVPVIIFICDMPSLRERLWKWMLIVYNYYLNRRVKNAQEAIELSRYSLLFLNDDDKGAFVMIGEEKFYLIAMKAKPLKGPLIGENYYTTIKSNAIIKVIDSKF